MSVMLNEERRMHLLTEITSYQGALACSEREYQRLFASEVLSLEDKLALENDYFIEKLLVHYLIGSLRNELAELRNDRES